MDSYFIFFECEILLRKDIIHGQQETKGESLKKMNNLIPLIPAVE